MDQDKKKMLKDLFFCLQLGFQVIGAFLLAVIVGLRLDESREEYYKKASKVLLKDL